MRSGNCHTVVGDLKKNIETKFLARTHIIETSENNLVSTMGGKWTIFMLMGEQTVDYKIMKIAPKKHPMNILREFLTIPLEITPKNPHDPWIENASSGSSICRYFNALDDKKYKMPLKIPITTDSYPDDTSQQAVIPTRPANKPLPNLVTL